MKLEHFGMAEPGDCRLVFTAGAEELAAAVAQVQAEPDAPQEEDGLLTEAVNRTILGGFSALYEQLVQEYHVVPVTDPDFELLAVNRAEGFRAGAQFYALPPLEVGAYTGFVQAVEPHPIRQLTIELEINRHHGDEERAADAAGKAALRRQVADPERFRALGRWAGTGLWLEVTAARGRTRPLPDGSAGRGRRSPTS